MAARGDNDGFVEGRSEPSVGIPADKFSWFQLLADTPIEQDEQDRLGFTAYADALAGLLDDPATSTPLTVAITGPWGSGKTSLAKMVEARLQRWPKERGEAPNIVCWQRLAPRRRAKPRLGIRGRGSPRGCPPPSSVATDLETTADADARL